MKENRIRGILRVLAHSCLLACGLLLVCGPARARAAEVGRQTVRALMVSDIHFEPFWDPGKAAQLAAAPVAQWNAILSAPPTPDQAARFGELQKNCNAKGVDTSYALLASSLRAMRADARGADFITLSGDLISHKFSCKFAAVFPHASPDAYQAFAAKTFEYVLAQLRGAFPGVPVYAALGNNDSGCGDYKLDADGEFLRTTAKAMTADVPAPERSRAQQDYAAEGYYATELTALHDARLVILDDNFMSPKYRTCAGKRDPAPAAAQIAWLRAQLERARRKHEKVWFMAHIPPGVDLASTAKSMVNVCSGEAPVMFLSSGAMADTLAEFGDVVRLAIFAHTHMDELRLLEPAEGGADRGPVAVKMVASISPVDGNNPSFTVAKVDAATAKLMDYRVFAASNQTGDNTAWSEEYDYAQTYDEPSFSASSVANLINRFTADPKALRKASQSYLRNYFVGDLSAWIKPFWAEYVCALENRTAASYRACACRQGL